MTDKTTCATDFARNVLPIVRIAGRDERWAIDDRLAHYKCPGVSVAAIKNGHLDWAAGFGKRGVDDPRDVDAETVFMVASCSKPVTAMLVLQHVDGGLIDLDVDVNCYLKRWQVPENEFTATEKVTLRRALSHTAGLNVNGWPVIPQGEPLPAVFDILEGRKPSIHPAIRVNKAPGGVFRYSGGGYLIAQMILEDQTGRSFGDLADELIFGPLGMTRSSFHHPIPMSLRDNIAGGHRMDGSPIPGGWMVSVDGGAGGLVSTAADYARFHIGCREAWLGKPGAILTRSLAQDMLSRQGEGTFGLGWDLVGDGSARRMNHGGSNDGYQSETDSFLESGDGGVALTNAVSGIYLFREILNGLADLYDWPGYLLAPKTVRTLTPEQQDNYVGTYKIVSGIELPVMNVWRDGDRLFNEIPGLRVGVREIFVDQNGIIFSQAAPFETHVMFGPDGRASEMAAFASGDTEILRAARIEDAA